MTRKQKTVLIVDDDDSARAALTTPLKTDYHVVSALSAEEAIADLREQAVNVMLVDVRQPGISGFELLQIARENYADVEVIMISAIDEVETVVQSMKHGAFHYVTKDVAHDALQSLVRLAVERQELSRQVVSLTAQVADQDAPELVIGSSKSLRDIVGLVDKVSQLSATVLILGESGTGKELLARLIHRKSDHASGPFIPVNLAAIPADLVESTLFGHERGSFTGAHRQQLGKFELATGGTLFLDEIGELRIDLQAKLLRAIQEGEIERIGSQKPIQTDFRLIVATNVDLEKAVKDGRFREDLFYRINVIPIRMPPLRERPEDIPDLCRQFVERYNGRFKKAVEGVSDSAIKLLSSHWWPGNIRELENLIERLIAFSDKPWITDEDLPIEYHLARLDTAGTDGNENRLQEACDTFERNFILRALERSEWNVSATARYLGIPLSTLKHKMGRLDIRELARRLRGA
ncbi:MAG: sigma-54 dependent transcriptional regulator [Vicinamibacterales bacterium]|jgi:DNA-binding NtrC family response regulator|nr:hypothetical protein [Acidobacteriota bacterium]MDP6372665.1 sigma-54 dependent transcriptional regulator [Vicinamibacterales bacterium]MDP6607931.1 sigma-54 dependent transcriptional regulator [Vicinamibacterales bacterium]HAK54056.1 hypothetical protein [Acidobacteriota bacterium]|tara:strand:- start:1825 stop:3216 length:1392 start_codon:yes stop_codon:yes gene_type:complete